jgi:hypothetical protein
MLGSDRVDGALGLAVIAGRFADGDLASIIDHLAAERPRLRHHQAQDPRYCHRGRLHRRAQVVLAKGDWHRLAPDRTTRFQREVVMRVTERHRLDWLLLVPRLGGRPATVFPGISSPVWHAGLGLPPRPLPNLIEHETVQQRGGADRKRLRPIRSR